MFIGRLIANRPGAAAVARGEHAAPGSLLVLRKLTAGGKAVKAVREVHRIEAKRNLRPGNRPPGLACIDAGPELATVRLTDRRGDTHPSGRVLLTHEAHPHH